MLPSHFPEPDLFDADGAPSLGWGIVGPGWIASEFVAALHTHTRQRPVAVASRSSRRADEFAARFEIPLATEDLNLLLGDAEVDVVYIAAPPSEHATLALAAIAAGKHVLIEKPMAVSAAEAASIREAARAEGVFAMEAHWTRYLPQASVLRRLIADGTLGEVQVLLADQGQAIGTGHRMRDPELGGGALLDLGIYAVAMSSELFGAPSRITAVGARTDTGVDAYVALALDHGGDRHATISTNLNVRTPGRAVVAGTDARVEIGGASPFHTPTELVLADPGFGTPRLTWSDPTGVTRFGALSWEANAVARFIGEGRRESPLHGLDETVSILATIDEARRQILDGPVG